MAPDAGNAPDAGSSARTAITATALGESGKHLDQLALCHYVLGGLTALSALPLIPYAMCAWEIAHWVGQPALSDSATQLLRLVRFIPGMDRPDYDDQLLGVTLVMALIPTIALMFMHGLVLACVGRWLARRRKYKTTFVISLLNLTNAPMGTALSAITLVVLLRQAAKQLYNPKPADVEPTPPNEN
ncbi:MAG: hypothetical protein HOL01_09440 [Planctomycetaceae bacterium]|jgi:hypothetical protein|nr:hypothetical protein [Planctomycetaceae bacterium]MBT6487917.1 hypothetical protein [Planctomycetaceae bacterium]MBT6494759.1 hypothetical protein [Planctomycetaceae bacterium]